MTHPVQFQAEFVAGGHQVSSCTVCGALVVEQNKGLHRRNHAEHNDLHRKIRDEANRYKSPPRYGGMR